MKYVGNIGIIKKQNKNEDSKGQPPAQRNALSRKVWRMALGCFHF